MSKKQGIARLFGAAAIFLGTTLGAQAQYYGYEPPASPLPSEDQLMAAGCHNSSRDFNRGTLTYDCPRNVVGMLGNPGPNGGPRCSMVGADQVFVRFVCRENVPDYDQDQPHWGRDYGRSQGMRPRMY